MASKNCNPYRDGSKYNEIFEYIRSHKIVTRQELLEAGFPVADVTVVLSPRAEGSSTRGGDCRGNYSARGHIYFMEKLNRKKKEVQRYRLRYRKVAMDKRGYVRPIKKKVDAQKQIIKVEQVAETVEA